MIYWFKFSIQSSYLFDLLIINLQYLWNLFMNFENSISLNFPAIIHEILETLKRFIFPKFHETWQP